MNAVSVYVNTAKLVLQTTEATAAATSLNPELSRLLFNLRQLLSCVVCNRLVTDPYSPQNGQCNHNVCRLCVRGAKILHPACSNCKNNKDYKTYNENKAFRCLLLCYKSLCEHLRCSAIFALSAGHKVSQYNNIVAPSGLAPQMSLQELIIEGASYDDILNAFSSDLPKVNIVPTPKHQQMPALVTPLTSITAATPLAPIQNPIKVTAMQMNVSKASTPPVVVSTPCTTYGPKIQVENTAQHFKHHSTTTSLSLPSTTCSQEHQTPSNVSLTNAQLIQLNQLKSSGNITYIGPNTRGIVVPIVSSAGSPAVPLSIASARIQTLNRQLSQVRGLAGASTTAAPTSAHNTTFNSNENRTALGSLKSATASVPTLSSSSSGSTSNASAATGSQLKNPPPIKTVSNGSAMYSVLYTGIGNKITIKRKTDGDEDTSQKKNTSISTTSCNLLQPLSKMPNKKRGCRCGNTTATPGKLTCCGQRCPCYVDSKSCVDCKCRGCRNPHRPDGNKVRPIIPELDCYEIQIADELGNVNELPIAPTSNVLNTINNDTNATNLTTNINLNATVSPTTVAAISTTSSNTTIIPLRSLHQFSSSSSASNSSSITTSIIPPLTSTIMPTQASSMAQTSFASTSASSTTTSVPTSMSSNLTTAGNIVQLDQIQKESLLIQNAEGKFQVVNFFTTANNNAGSSSCTGPSTQIPSLQRIKGLPQTIVSAHNSFVLPSSITTTSMSGTTTTTTLPQLILQSQHQPSQHLLQHSQQHQQQPHVNHQIMTSQRISNNINTNSLPLQLQQQLKQNIITVHAIQTNPTSNTSPITAPVLTPSSSPAPTSATISLPPLVTSNPHSNSELSDSSEVSRNTYTNIIVSSSADNSKTPSSSISSIPLTVSLPGTVHTQSFNRKSVNSPNI